MGYGSDDAANIKPESATVTWVAKSKSVTSCKS